MSCIGSDPSNAFRHLELLRTGPRRGWASRACRMEISRYGPVTPLHRRQRSAKGEPRSIRCGPRCCTGRLGRYGKRTEASETWHRGQGGGRHFHPFSDRRLALHDPTTY